VAVKAPTLDAIRHEIDAIDDRLLALLAERFAAVARIRAAKAGDGSPLRPAREAAILRRLADAPVVGVPLALKVRIWRAIIAASALEQANIRVHLSTDLANSVQSRLTINEHFGDMTLIPHAGDRATLEALGANPGDIAILTLGAAWLVPYLAGAAGAARIIGCLPMLARRKEPEALIFGTAAAEPTGTDETLVMTEGNLPRDFTPAPLWQAKFGGRQIAALPGFLEEKMGPLVGIIRSNAGLGLKVLGRYPSPIEARP
jgi:chorismate mutase / prephenate dehydratase